MDPWNDFNDLQLNVPDCSQLDSLADVVPFGSFTNSASFSNLPTNNSSVMGSSSQSQAHSSVMTVYVHSSPFCPVDHSKDPEIIQTFYKLVKTYTLPKLSNVTLKTVHRCFLSEIGPVHRAAVGDGGTAAVIVRDGVNLGLLYIENQRQAEAVCDIVTSVITGQVVGEVPRLLVGAEAVRYIAQVCQ